MRTVRGSRERGARSEHSAMGRLCLEFAATLHGPGGSGERLQTAADLGRWFCEAGLTQTPPSVPTHELHGARRLREAIYRAAGAASEGRRPSRAEVDEINARAATHAAPQLDRSTGGIIWISPRPVQGALSLIARDAVDLLGGELAPSIRRCEGEGCRAVFLDSSRGGTRRWCSMETCGNRIKVAAYQDRQRTRSSRKNHTGRG